MAENSKIEWTDHTFNPWIGCTKVSQGCKHCYAETLMDKRYKRVKWGATGERKRTSAANWKKPLVWDKKAKKEGRRYKVFCSSLADVFEDNPQLIEWRCDLWDLIEVTTSLDWLLLTKRPENVLEFTKRWSGELPQCLSHWPENVWIGTSVENQSTAEVRVPYLLRVPAAVRFLSCEPLLGPIDLSGILSQIHWCIVGGESGINARPMSIKWATSLVDQCQVAGVKVFVKQLGSNPVKVGDWQGKEPVGTPLKLTDSKGGDVSEWPEALRVREMPKPKRSQRKRTKGWRMPENALYVGRPTRWGNPFNWKDADPDLIPAGVARRYAVEAFEEWLTLPDQNNELSKIRQWILDHVHELRGKHLVCWCKPNEPCHADVLLDLANKD